MTIINLYTRDQELYTTERPKVAAGNEKTVQVYVSFDSAWDGYAKSAVFHTAKDSRVYEEVLVNNRCLIPKEVIADAGQLFIGVRGLKGETVKQSLFVRYKIEKGADGVLVFDPSPDVYSQLLKAYGSAEAALDSLTARFDNIIANTGFVEGDEVVDARQGYDGTVHANLYKAITEQIKTRIDYKTNGYVYPPSGANLDIAGNDDGSVSVTVYADSLTAITPGSPEYGGVAIPAETILAQLPGKAALNDDGHLVFTVPEYNALCFNGADETLVIKSIRTISNADKVLIYNSWANACGGSFMDFYNRKEHEEFLKDHGKIIDFVGMQKSYVYAGSDGLVGINKNGSTGTVEILLNSGITFYPADSDDSLSSVTFTKEIIVEQLGSRATISDEGTLSIVLNTYQALCLDFEAEKLVVRHIRHIKPQDIVLLYNAWANIQGALLNKLLEVELEKGLASVENLVNLQKAYAYIGSDGKVTINKNDFDGSVSVVLKNGITVYNNSTNSGVQSYSISIEDIADQLGEFAEISDDGSLSIKMNSYNALCVSLSDPENVVIVLRHLRNIQPYDIVLLYNAWANIRGLLFEKEMDHNIRDIKAQLASINAFNSGDLTYGIDTAAKCAEFADVFNNSAETESFLFFTDPHLLEKGEEWEANLKKYIVTLEKYYKSTPTSFILCGGDWLGNSDTPTEAKYKLGYIDGFMNGMFDKYYSVLGNHDTNYQGKDAAGNTHAGILDNQTIANLWFRKYGKNYYSFDGNNTRFYVLDTGTDWDDTLSAYRLAQIEWLGKMLQTEDQAHSSIAMHIYFAHDDGRKSTFAGEIDTLIEAYHDRLITPINGITYDFSKCTGRVEFIITGHTHADMTGFADAKTPVICTLNTRNGNTPSFDLVYADYNNRKINLVRVGTGANRVVSLAT